MPDAPKLLDQVRNLIRLKHMSHKTGRAYVAYIREYILFHDKTRPKEMGLEQIREDLTQAKQLAIERHTLLEPFCVQNHSVAVYIRAHGLSLS
ncbi:MAG TPA: hypothetical protein DEA22_00145 [Blastocatellia bacterium]|nr:hypothetical protein [Blastocatellia bacterium]